MLHGFRSATLGNHIFAWTMWSHLNEHPREVLEGVLVSKAHHEAHHEADEEEDVGNHEPGDLHQDRPGFFPFATCEKMTLNTLCLLTWTCGHICQTWESCQPCTSSPARWSDRPDWLSRKTSEATQTHPDMRWSGWPKLICEGWSM